jgi:hypothetical protein
MIPKATPTCKAKIDSETRHVSSIFFASAYLIYSLPPCKAKNGFETRHVSPVFFASVKQAGLFSIYLLTDRFKRIWKTHLPPTFLKRRAC